MAEKYGWKRAYVDMLSLVRWRWRVNVESTYVFCTDTLLWVICETFTEEVETFWCCGCEQISEGCLWELSD